MFTWHAIFGMTGVALLIAAPLLVVQADQVQPGARISQFATTVRVSPPKPFTMIALNHAAHFDRAISPALFADAAWPRARSGISRQ